MSEEKMKYLHSFDTEQTMYIMKIVLDLVTDESQQKMRKSSPLLDAALSAVEGVAKSFHETALNVDRQCAYRMMEDTDLAAALKELHDETVEYAMINNLGGYDNHVLKNAREALEKSGYSVISDVSGCGYAFYRNPTRNAEVV